MKISIVLNNTSWGSIDQKVQAIKDFYAPLYQFDIDVKHTSFSNIPFTTVSSIGGIDNTKGSTTTVAQEWYDQYITSLSPDADIIVLYLNPTDDDPPRTSVGIMQGKYSNVVQCCIFGINETDHAYIYDQKTGTEIDQGNCFAVFCCHEISHALYLLENKPVDNTHLYFYTAQQTKVLDDLQNTRWFILDKLINYYYQLLGLLKQTKMKTPSNNNTTEEVLIWDTPADARHSVRVLCDQLGLTLDHTENVDGVMYKPKDVICACIEQESRFNPKAIGAVNDNGTTDWGICQFNDGTYPINGQRKPIWIGEGADFPNTQYVLDNPEKCVRVMIREFKRGHIGKWSSYSTGAYKQWL